jgi:hypothetical protein
VEALALALAEQVQQLIILVCHQVQVEELQVPLVELALEVAVEVSLQKVETVFQEVAVVLVVLREARVAVDW